jgi:hypothetical protein
MIKDRDHTSLRGGGVTHLRGDHKGSPHGLVAFFGAYPKIATQARRNPGPADETNFGAM